jgi:hypothetical protein
VYGCSLDEILISIAATEVSKTSTEVVSRFYTFIFHGSWMGKGKGVVASFRLEPVKLGSWSFLQVATCKYGVGASF